MTSSNQLLIKLGRYLISEHALRRIKSRLIKEDEILFTLDSPDSVAYRSHHERTIVYHKLTDISVIIDNKTNIIVTVTETESRKCRLEARKRMVHWTSLGTVYYPAVLCN